MTRPIRLEPEAAEELLQAARWYERRRRGLGTEFLSTAAAIFTALAERPSIGTPVPRIGAEYPARRVLLRRFPHAVVFLEVNGTIRIVAIAHERRRPGYWVGGIRR